MVLHYLSSPGDGIAEAARILKGGGRLIIVDLDKHSNEEMREKFGHRWLGFSLDDMARLLRGSGFAPIATTRHDVKKGLAMNMILSMRE
jgi:ArsR family transcriptional regulator